MGRYDAISFVPPQGVRTACARGIALHEEGHGGDGLQPETVAWARRMSRGEAVSPEKATKMNAWFARHATSPGEAEARRTDKKSPAWVAWLLWGGDAGRRWARRLVRQMGAADRRAKREMALAYGMVVALSVPPTDAEGGPWCVLAYEAELKGYRLADGTHARITAADIDAMVKNFARYPKSPIVVEHADTREGMPAEWAEPRGHVVALRRGSMEREVGGVKQTVATLEGRLDVSPEVRLSIVGDPATQTPPTWPFCSITTAKGIDEETGASLGTVLYSVSLTAHPRLKDLPRLAASQDLRGDGSELGHWYGEITDRASLVEMLRRVLDLPVATGEPEVLTWLARVEDLDADAAMADGIELDDIVERLRAAMRLPALTTRAEVVTAIRNALTTLPGGGSGSEMSRGAAAVNHAPKEGTAMPKFIEMAAKLKLTAVATEEAAESAVLSLAQDGATVREVLGLKPDTTVAAELATITAERTELGKLRVEVKDLRAEAEKRAEAELSRRVEEVLVSEGATGDEKRARALAAYARADRAGFDRDYPAPSVQELAQRAQDGARMENITGEHGSAAAASKAADPAKTPSLEEHVTALMTVYAEHGVQLTRVAALRAHMAGETADKARAAFASVAR